MTTLNTHNLITKAYDNVQEDIIKGSGLTAEFVLAARGINGKWRMIKVDAYQNDDGTQKYRYTKLSSDDLETLDVLQKMAAFEDEKRDQGQTERPAITYPNTRYFRDAAAEHAIVFDTDTGIPAPLENGLIPARDGDYDAQDIAEAAATYQNASEDNNKKRSNKGVEFASPMDELLSPFAPQGIDWHTFAKTSNTRSAIDNFCESCAALEYYLSLTLKGVGDLVVFPDRRGITRHKTDITKSSDRDICLPESYENAIKTAKDSIEDMKKIADPRVIDYMNDALKAFLLTRKIIDYKKELKYALENNQTLSAEALRKELVAMAKEHNLSDDMQASLERASLDIEHISMPAPLSDINRVLSGWRNDVQTLYDMHLKGISKKGETPRDLSQAFNKAAESHLPYAKDSDTPAAALDGSKNNRDNAPRQAAAHGGDTMQSKSSPVKRWMQKTWG